MLYLEGGVRTSEIGSLMFEHQDPVTGEHLLAPVELLRFAIPRRVYTRSHLEYVGEVAAKVVAQKEQVRGIKITKAPAILRHFVAELDWV